MEKDVRGELVNSVLNTPHRKVEELVPLHKTGFEADPLFYTKLSVYYDRNGEIRDHKKLFAASIVGSHMVEFRELGQLLMKKLSPKDLNITVDVAISQFGCKTGGKKRRIRATCESFLRKMEDDAANGGSARFLKNAKFLRDLYRKLQIKPDPRAAASLRFQSAAKPYEAFAQVKQLSKMTEESEICTFIVESQVPSLQAFGALNIKMTPAIAAALTTKMSPRELQNFTQMLKKKGLLEDKAFKDAVKKKMTKAAKSGNLSMRGTAAKKVLGKDADIMSDATDDFVASLPMIKKKVALFIDKSSSMSTAITLGKEVSSILASKVENPSENLFIAAFNNTASVIPVPTNTTHSEFEITFRYMKASGMTSLGSALQLALDRNFDPDVVIYISDGDENDTPFYETVIRESGLYGQRFIGCLVGRNIKPLKLSKEVKMAKAVEIENIDFSKGDYYGLPNLVKTIAAGGVKDLIREIDDIDIFAEIEQMREAAL